MVNQKTPKCKAKEFLKKDLVVHIGAFLTVTVCIMALLTFAATISSVVYNLVTDNYLVYDLVLFVFLIFTAIMGVSLIAGLLVFEFNCAKGEKPDIKDIFYPFSSAKVFFRLWYLIIELTLRAVLYFLPAGIIAYVFGGYVSGHLTWDNILSFYGFDLTYTLLCVLTVILFILGGAYYAKYFTAVHLALERESMPIHSCFFAARVYNYCSYPDYVSVIISFIPLIVLSILTLGVTLVYVIPLIFLTCFCTARDICDNHTALQVKLDVISDGTYFEGFNDEDFENIDVFDDKSNKVSDNNATEANENNN